MMIGFAGLAGHASAPGDTVPDSGKEDVLQP